MLEELRSSGSLVTHDVIVSTHQTNNSSNTNNNANNKVDDFKDLSKMLTRSFEKEEYLKKRKGLSIKVYEMSWDCYRRCISYLISEFFTNVDRKENNNHQNISKVKFEPEVIVCIMTGANIICDSIQEIIGKDKIEITRIWIRRTLDDSVGAEKRSPKVYKQDDDFAEKIKGKKVLILDDVAKYGETMLKAVSEVMKYEPKHVKTGTLCCAKSLSSTIDFVGTEIEQTDWVLFPFKTYHW